MEILTREESSCKECGVSLVGNKPKRVFCCKKCYSSWQKKNIRGNNAPSWKEKEKSICPYCKKSFYAYPSNTKKGKGKYCSKECFYKSREYPQGEKHPMWRGGKTVIFCKLCGKRKEKKKWQVKKYGDGFCSQDCWHKWCVINEDGLVRKGERNFRWQGGISNSPYPSAWTQKLKKQIRERDNYTCQICGKAQKKKAFAVHHVDYNKKNNQPENLITLCNVCHPMTNGNRRFWKKWFIKKRCGGYQCLFNSGKGESCEDVQREMLCVAN